MTVEERQKDDKYLLSIFEDVAKTQIPPQVAYTWIQERIAASHAEGVAEERERILEVADRVSVGSPVADMAGTHDYISTEPRSSRDRNREAPISRAIRGFVDSESLCENGGEATGEGRARASVNIFIVPASVLAPTKETDND